MAGHDIIVIGGSAGGLEGVLAIARGLPADLPAAVLVVLHASPSSPNLLPAILSRAGPLPAAHAADGQPVVPGRIYVAMPDHHLLLEAGRVRVTRGPKAIPRRSPSPSGSRRKRGSRWRTRPSTSGSRSSASPRCSPAPSATASCSG